MKPPTWLAPGTWCLFEFKVCQVKEDKDYFAISDGMFETSGQLWDRCVPLTLHNKAISDNYRWHSDRIHKEGHNGLNYPDIHRWLVDHWMVTIAGEPKGEKDQQAWFGGRYKEVREFVDDMLQKQGVNRWGFETMRRK